MLLNSWFSVFLRKENIVGKGENTGYQHFLLLKGLLPKVFKSWYSVVRSYRTVMNCVEKRYLLITQFRLSTTLKIKLFEDNVEKGENASNQQISPFPTIFLTISETNVNFLVTFILSSANAFNLDQPKNYSFGKELKTIILQRINFH